MRFSWKGQEKGDFLIQMIAVLEMKIWIYWSESNSRIYIYAYIVYLNKNWKMYWSEQRYTGLWPVRTVTAQ